MRDEYDARLQERLSARLRPDTRLPWHDDPARFARECIEWPTGAELATYQANILTKLVTKHKVAVRSLHGVGKTTTNALALLWFACTRDAAGIDWKAITTAGAWRQLEVFLWPEIRLWARRLRWDVLQQAGWKRGPFSEADELMLLTLRLRHGAATAVASTDPTLIEGAHAQEILYEFDESKSIIPAVFDSAEGAFSTGNAFALAQSTPGTPMGRFYDIHARKRGYEDWTTVHVTLEQAVAAGRVKLSWAEQRALQWGKTSAIYLNRVRGEFASSDEDSVVPLEWVEQANLRWHGFADGTDEVGPVTDLGVDVARGGEDKTVLAPRHGDHVAELRYLPFSKDTMVTVGHVLGILRLHPECRAVIDVLNMGAGVVDRLGELENRSYRDRVVGFNAGAGVERYPFLPRRDRTGEQEFLNARSAAWWCLREQLDPAYGPTLMLPPDDLLTGDLATPKHFSTSAGKIQIESKDEIRKRLGRSTDSGDAVVQACFPRPRRRRRRSRMLFGGTVLR